MDVREAETKLSSYLDQLAQGETILLCKHDIPIAEIRPLPPPRTGKRPIGLEKGKLTVPKEFFDPLPQEMIDAFEGKS